MSIATSISSGPRRSGEQLGHAICHHRWHRAVNTLVELVLGRGENLAFGGRRLPRSGNAAIARVGPTKRFVVRPAGKAA
jgi:hypothetical protein